MTPDQVPDEWIDTVIRTAADFTHADMCGCDGWPRDCSDSLTIGQLEADNEREVIAAAYPLIAAHVRAELAADLYERAMLCPHGDKFRAGLLAASRVARGEVAEEREPKPTITMTVTPDTPAVQRAIRDVRRRGGA
jgi:hypothetical protein